MGWRLKKPLELAIWWELMALEVRSYVELRIGQRNIKGAFIGIVRKLLNLTFLGETREGEGMFVGDIIIKKGISDVRSVPVATPSSN